MNTNQTLQDLIEKQTPEFIEVVLKSENAPYLNELLKRVKTDDKKAIIAARIEKLNYLMI